MNGSGKKNKFSQDPTPSQLYTHIDRIFFSDGYNVAKQLMGEVINISNMLKMCNSVYEAVDGLIDAFISRCRREGKEVMCRKGCYLCCCQAVLVLPYEALFIHNYIRQHLSKEEIIEMQQNAIRKDEITCKMKAQQFLHYKYPCPLLKDGICMVYDARPMACRTYLSSDKDGCIHEYHNPSDIDIFPDLYEFTIRAGRMINEGICSFLIENHIFPTEWQIESLLRTAFEKQDVFERWMQGENIFQTRNYSDDEIRYLNDFGTRKNPNKK